MIKLHSAIRQLQQVAETAAGVATTLLGHASLDLTPVRLDDFFAVYSNGDRITDPRHLGAWRRDLHVALMLIRPARQPSGMVTLGIQDILRFMAYLHRNDVQIADVDVRQRTIAFLKALPHIARQ